MGYTDVSEISGIVDGLHTVYKSGITRPLEWRRRQLKALERMVEENEEAFAKALNDDLHRSRVASLMFEVWDIIGQVSYMLENLESFAKEDKLSTPLSMKPLSYEVWKEPYGVVTVISPWNFPLGLLLNPLAGALAAGNACVLKPSEVSASCSQLLAELIPKYLDTSAVAVVTGGVEQAKELLAQKVDKIQYTGGSKVGRIVMAEAAKNLTPVTLELGGKCPTYVDESANIETSARRICFFKNLNAGQVCIAPDFVMVHQKVRDAFLKHLEAVHASMFPGKEQECEEKCRIISDAHFNRVSSLLQDSHGGQVLMGGKPDAADKFIPFTIVVDPSPDCALMQDEIFAPILPVFTVQSVDEAIAMCGGKPTPLASYVFEQNPSVGKKWLTEVPSGGACVNDCTSHIMHKEGGLGGKGESGMGATRGRASFDTFTHRKVVALQSPGFELPGKYPPYKELPSSVKMILTGRFPAWIKLVYWGTLGAVVAGVGLVLRQHVSVSIQLR